MALTGVQIDCLEARGDCARCLHFGLMESGPCRVKYSHGVAQKLGLKTLRPSSDPDQDEEQDDATSRPKLAPVLCDFKGPACMGWFDPGSAVARFCPACRPAAYERERDVICGRCGSTYFGKKKPRLCPSCSRS